MSENQGVPTYVVYIGIFVTVFVAALGVFLLLSNSKSRDYNIQAKKYEPEKSINANKPSASASSELLKVTIASPEDNSFVNNTNIKVAGAAKPGTTVTITGGVKDVISDTNTDGSFAIDVQLKEGENSLTITVFDQTGQQKTITRTIFAILEG